MIGTSIIEINTDIIDEKRNLTILNMEYRDGCAGRRLWYNYICNICGYVGWHRKSAIDKGTRCQCCSGEFVVKGINDLATKRPDLIEYFYNKTDSYTNTIGSNKYVDIICPTCKNIKNMCITNLVRNGLSCTKCSDGIPKTEKFVYNILHQLNASFIYQYKPSWSQGKKYDFAIFKDGQTIVVETHGDQHYEEKPHFKQTLLEIQSNDSLKYDLALCNGVEKYIVINCSKTNFDYMKENVINSALSQMYNLSNINWDDVLENTNRTLLKSVAEIWNGDILDCTSKTVADSLNISKTTAKKYLKMCSTLGMVSYNPLEETKKNNQRTSSRKNIKYVNTREINIYKDNALLKTHISARELESSSIELYGVFLRFQNIWQVCNGKMKTYKGYYFSYAEVERIILTEKRR